jgi:hypothetical protein
VGNVFLLPTSLIKKVKFVPVLSIGGTRYAGTGLQPVPERFLGFLKRYGRVCKTRPAQY